MTTAEPNPAAPAWVIEALQAPVAEAEVLHDGALLRYRSRPTMKKRISFGHAMAATFLAIAASMSGTAAAQAAPASSHADKWHFTAGLYGYFGTIKGTILSGTSSTDIPT